MNNDDVLKKAYNLFMQNKYGMAICLYESVLDTTDDCNALNIYGICLVKVKKFEKAIEVFESIIKKYPCHGDAWYSLGRTYLILGDETNEQEYITKAIEHLNTANKYLTDGSDSYFYLGLCYEKANNPQKAIENYLISLDFYECSETHINIGWCYIDIGDLPSALKHTKAAYEMDPDNLDCLKFHAHALIKSKRRQEAYNLLLKSPLDYSEDCLLLDMIIHLSLETGDFDTADKNYYKLKRADKNYMPMSEYEFLKQKAQLKAIVQ